MSILILLYTLVVQGLIALQTRKPRVFEWLTEITQMVFEGFLVKLTIETYKGVNALDPVTFANVVAVISTVVDTNRLLVFAVLLIGLFVRRVIQHGKGKIFIVGIFLNIIMELFM